MKQLSSNGLGLAAGILSGICMLVMGLLAMGGVYLEAYEVMKSFHLFFDATLLGMLAGIIEAFVFSYVIGYAFGWIYNAVTK